MWEEGGRCFDKTRLGEAPILDTIEQWEDKAFQNAIANRLWALLPEFIVWTTWKEHNLQIFESRMQSPQEVWKIIHAQIIETLGLTIWGLSDL